jgi:hypothetical protein
MLKPSKLSRYLNGQLGSFKKSYAKAGKETYPPKIGNKGERSSSLLATKGKAA